MSGFQRYVALGDSQTEGQGDLDAAGLPVGWADRFAGHLAATTSPGLAYANLALGGCRARHVVEVQLPVALALEPDLATVVAGANDLLRHDFDLDESIDALESAFAALTSAGATVATMTIPDVGAMLPVLRWLRPRERAFNARLVEAATRHGVRVLEVYSQPLCGDPGMWSADRIHGSRLGHTRIAHGMAELFGLPGFDDSWRGLPLDPMPLRSVVRRDAHWLVTFAVPFLARQLRGRGPYGTAVAKRPELLPVEVLG